MQGLQVLEAQKEETLRQVSDYAMPNVSDKVVRIILSYTGIVNKVVWQKN
jgi:UDP-N-acetyl-L-fucosamine synthase